MIDDQISRSFDFYIFNNDKYVINHVILSLDSIHTLVEIYF